MNDENTQLTDLPEIDQWNPDDFNDLAEFDHNNFD